MHFFSSRSPFVRLSVVESAPDTLAQAHRESSPNTRQAEAPGARGVDSGPLGPADILSVPARAPRFRRIAPFAARARRVAHVPLHLRAKHACVVRPALRRTGVLRARLAARGSMLLPVFRRPMPVREAPAAVEAEVPLGGDLAHSPAHDAAQVALDEHTAAAEGSVDASSALSHAMSDDLSEGQLRRRVWSLALPSIGEQVLALGVGVSDTFLSGHLTSNAEQHLGYDRATAVAAVGIAGTTTWVVVTVFLAVNVGVTALVARAVGARDRALANRAASQGALVGFLIGLVMIALAVPLADVIIAALGVTGEVAVLSAQFIRVFSLGLPFTGAASAATAAMRGAGDTRRPLLVMLLVNGVNVVASWTLLNGVPQLGIAPIGVVGSACGAAAGWTLGSFGALYLLSRRHPRAPQLALRLLRPQRDLIARILRVGLPSAAEYVVLQIGVLTFGREVISLGSTSYAAYTTINTVENLGSLPGFGFAVAATALVGQALGARKPQLAVRVVWATLQPCFAVMAAVGLLAVFVPHLLMGLFVDDPSVIQTGEMAMRISFFTLCALAFSYVFNGALRGAGDTKFPVVVRAAGTWGLRVPISLILIPLFSLPGARMCMALDFWVQAGLAYWRFRGGKWRTAKV